MSVEALLVAGQRAAERLMVDTCIIRRRTGETTDPNTGQTTPIYIVVYDDPETPGAGAACRIKMTTSLGTTPGRDQESGGQAVTVSQMLLQLPFAAAGINTNDEAEILTSRDADQVGRKLRIDGPFGQTDATMRRYLVEEVT